MITLHHVTKKYGKQVVLDNKCMTIEDGSFVSISGSSGSGKMTLLNIMGLLE